MSKPVFLQRLFESRRRLFSVGLYAVTNFMPRLTGAILGIVYATQFSLLQYGVYGILAVALVALAPLVDLGVPQGILRNYYDHSHEPAAACRYLADVTFTADIISLLLLPVIALGMVAGWHLTGAGRTYYLEYIALLLGICYLERSSASVGAALRVLEKPVHFAAGQIVDTLVALTCGIVFVTVFHWAIMGAMLAVLLARLCSAIVCRLVFSVLLGIRGGRFNWQAVRACLIFGLPMVPTRLAIWGREAGLRPVLSRVTGLVDVGLFSFASAVAALPIIASSAVEFVLLPHYFKQRQAQVEDFSDRVETFATVFMALLLPVCAGMQLFAFEIIRTLINARYAAAAPICAILACVTFVRIQIPFLMRQIQFARRTHILPIVTVPCALLSIGLALFLTPVYGIAAAAWVVLLSEILSYLALVRDMRRHERVHHPVLLTSGFVAFLTIIALWLNTLHQTTILLPLALLKLAIFLIILAVCAAAWIWPRRAFLLGIARG